MTTTNRLSKVLFSYPWNYAGVRMDEFKKKLQSICELEILHDNPMSYLSEKDIADYKEKIDACDYYLFIYNAFGTSDIADVCFKFGLSDEINKRIPKVLNIKIGSEGKEYKPVSFINSNLVFDLGFLDTPDVDKLFDFLIVNSSQRILVIETGELDNPNSIIKVSSSVNEQLIRYFSANPNKLKTIDRRQFEEIVAELFHGFGFNVELTKQTRDGGRDVIAIKHSVATVKYLIECKRPDIGNLVTVNPVRELFGVKHDEKATKAILVTTSYFSPDAKLYFERNKWELDLKDFDGLTEWLDEYKRIKGMTS